MSACCSAPPIRPPRTWRGPPGRAWTSPAICRRPWVRRGRYRARTPSLTDMHAHAEEIAIPNPGPAVFPARVRSLLLGATAIGVIVFVLALLVDPQRAWYSFLTNYLFFLVLGIGGAFLVALEYITSATWTVVFRRLPEAASSFLPAAFLLGIVFLFGVPYIYPWAKPGFHGFLTHGKQVWFSMPFYSARTLFTLAAWVLFGTWFVRNSTRQDTQPG